MSMPQGEIKMTVIAEDRHEDAWKDTHWLKQGHISHFPLCCILFFMDVFDQKFRDFISADGKERQNGEKIWYEHGDGYIRCPECIARDVGMGSWNFEEDMIYLEQYLGKNQETIPSSIYGVNDQEVV